MPKTYWFKRLKDGENIPIEGEQQASRLFQSKEFDRIFEYLGWSDGKEYQKVIATGKNLSKAEHAKIMETGIQDEKRADLIHKAWEAELQSALNNPDKTRPQYLSWADIDGKPLQGRLKDLENQRI